MRRNADGAGDLFAPMEIGEEVLAEALACHGGNSVAGEVRQGIVGRGIARGQQDACTASGDA
ncbi:MAG: hypothetical protein DMG49_21085 [Acidobacteria bacterium]|nr:MAG: hypothetical protein DMG49_21085 [Acidobacteriota bacterium]